MARLSPEIRISNSAADRVIRIHLSLLSKGGVLQSGLSHMKLSPVIYSFRIQRAQDQVRDKLLF
jgi:hypothetical protein